MSVNVTNLGRSGLYDWLLQRVSAVVLGVYFIVLMGFFLTNGDLDYVTWKAFMSCMPMKVSTIIVFLSVAAHAWVGIWTITTDYLIKNGHFGSYPTLFRVAVQSFCVLFLFACTLWGTMLIWGL